VRPSTNRILESPRCVSVWALVSALTLSLACTRHPAHVPPTLVESPVGAVGAEGVLTQGIGMETLGGVFQPLLKVGSKEPCEVTRLFTTGDDNQSQITIWLYRGNAEFVAANTLLGSFQVQGFTRGPRGTPAVAVTLRLSSGSLSIEAFDQVGNRQLPVVRVQGGA
jgi:molecular chaperone DnaK (HSP70)